MKYCCRNCLLTVNFFQCGGIYREWKVSKKPLNIWETRIRIRRTRGRSKEVWNRAVPKKKNEAKILAGDKRQWRSCL